MVARSDSWACPGGVHKSVDAGGMWGFGSPYWSLVLGPRVHATSTLVWTPLGCGQTLSPCHLCHHPPSSSVLPRIHAASTPSWMPRGSQGVCHSATLPLHPHPTGVHVGVDACWSSVTRCPCVHVCVHAPGEVWGAVIYGSKSQTRCWSGSCCGGRPTVHTAYEYVQMWYPNVFTEAEIEAVRENGGVWPTSVP